MTYEVDFLIALATTITIEISVLFVMLRVVLRIPQSIVQNDRVIFSGIFASFATLPYLWFILPVLIQERIAFIMIGEVTVTLFEAIFYCFVLNLSFKRAFSVSVICNLVSFISGLLIS